MTANFHYTIKKMSPQRLVADINHSIEFYTIKLGFEIDFRYEDFYAGISKDGVFIHLKTNQCPGGEKHDKTEDQNLDIVFMVENISDLYVEFSNGSIDIIQPLREMPYGKEFYIADPDQNILAFVE